MTREYLELIKADLLAEYQEELCEESIESIHAASTPEEFIGLLAKFSAFLGYKCLPRAEWVKKWFNTTEYKELAQTNGVYFDGIHAVKNPTLPLVVMGDAEITLLCDQPHMYKVTLQENSRCSITAFYSCFINVRKKDDSRCSIFHKSNLSRIKIRKI